MVVPAHRFRDQTYEPQTAPCAGCGVRLRVAASVASTRKVAAFSEARDTFGRQAFYCRECTEELYRT